MRRRSRTGGFTLLELMVYMGVLTIIMGVASVFYYGVMAQSRGVTRNVEDVIRAVQAGEKWREDVRSATAPPVLADGVLRVPRGDSETLYRFSDGQVERKRGEGTWEPFLLRVAASRVLPDKGKHVTAWRWEVELASRERAGMRPLFTFKAAR